MSQNSGPFLVSSHGPPGFHPRLPSSSSSPTLKRTSNGPLSIGNSPNTSMSTNLNVSTPPSLIRSSNSMGTLKSTNVNMNPMDKSNSMPYTSRYTRKAWPMSRNIHDKNIRGYDEHELPYNRPGLPSHNVPPSDNLNNSSFTIEPSTDDDEADDIIFSSRHMAAARFQRNQRLLCEIFNEVCIPDLRSNINVDRILTLRRQVDALKTHRQTFEKDLNELEEKHAEKKRKFLESNEKFYNEYNEASSTNLSQEKINEILQKYEAIEKLQKEKQLLLQQQQQQTVTIPPQQLPPPAPLPATTVSQPISHPVTKTEPVPIVEVPQQQTPTPPPPPIQTQLPPSQSVPHSLPSTQSVPSSLPHAQHLPPPLPPVPSSLPTPQSMPSQLPPSQSLPSQLPSLQAVQSQMPSSQPVQPQLPPPQPPVMPQVPPLTQQQQQQPTTTPQGYPMMHPAGGYPPVPGYVHPQQTQYRPPMNQRSAQYPSNVQWQQQQWQANAYDSRYYNPYPPNVQWQQQQQQQWPPTQPQQPMGVVSQQQPSQMRGPPHQQQPPMYANGVHYGYGGTSAGWNPNTHPPQQYGYPSNPSYDPTLVSAPPQQQYYPSPSQMHNPPQGYDYGPSPSQQQIPPQ
ncbi:unnamed protein product [Rotaria sp. Silwood2]|nr:unnamed protein product [Rotaria sp. Silwood2]CAF3976960.1 unnamed protein product [Rotaria sp. Silwood2]